jgi:uncharacterized protein
VISALLFPHGRLAWLRWHWRGQECIPLISYETAAELTQVLRYPKFKLNAEDARELLAEYIVYCEVIEVTKRCSIVCRDKNDQPFLDLAQSGRADVLVSGDRDLLALTGQTVFSIETPDVYRRRVDAMKEL